MSTDDVPYGYASNLAAWFLLLIIGCSVPVIVWIVKYRRKATKKKKMIEYQKYHTPD